MSSAKGRPFCVNLNMLLRRSDVKLPGNSWGAEILPFLWKSTGQNRVRINTIHQVVILPRHAAETFVAEEFYIVVHGGTYHHSCCWFFDLHRGANGIIASPSRRLRDITLNPHRHGDADNVTHVNCITVVQPHKIITQCNTD